MRGTGLLCVFVLCGIHVDMVTGNLNEFFQNFGEKISDAWHYTWNNILDNIKKPVKVKRLGRLGKLKTTTGLPTTDTSTLKQIDNEFVRKIAIDNEPLIPPFPERKRLTDKATERIVADIEKEIFGMQHLETESRNARLTKLTIPHLQPPKWTSIDDWRMMHKPIYGRIREHVDDNKITLAVPPNAQRFHPRRAFSTKNSELAADEVPILSYNEKNKYPSQYHIGKVKTLSVIPNAESKGFQTRNKSSKKGIAADEVPLLSYTEKKEFTSQNHKEMPNHNRRPRSITHLPTFVQIVPEDSDYFDILEKYKSKRAEKDFPSQQTFIRVDVQNSNDSNVTEEDSGNFPLSTSLPTEDTPKRTCIALDLRQISPTTTTTTTTEKYLKYRFKWSNLKIKFVYSWFVNDI